MASPSDNPLKRLIREIHRRSLWQVLGIFLLGGWVAFEAVQTLTEGLGLPEWFPAFAIVLLIIGLPVVLATAFVQEGGPGRDARDVEEAGPAAHAPRSGASSLFTWRNAILGGVSALTLLSGVGVGWLLFGAGSSTGPTPTSIEQSVAVLPFVNMSGDPDNEYFSDGITEELLNALSQIPDLRVPARTSSFSFKGRNIPVREIAEALGVAHVLEGSVRRDGDRVVITAQLVDAQTDSQLWSGRFERELDDIFAIQREIATAIADQFQVTLSGDQQTQLVAEATESAEAHEAYLRGRYFLNQRTGVALQTAITEFQRAVDLDPAYADAYSGLADSYVLVDGYVSNPEDVDFRANLDRGLNAARESVSLAPDLGMARASMGLALWAVGEWDGSERAFHRAIELNPGYAPAPHWYAELLYSIGRAEEGVVQALRALELDPMSRINSMDLAMGLFAVGRTAEAIEQVRETTELVPDWSLGWWTLAMGLVKTAEYDEGLEAWDNYVRLANIDVEPAREAYRAAVRFHETGEPQTFPDFDSTLLVAIWIYAQTGQAHRASEFFQAFVRPGAYGIAALSDAWYASDLRGGDPLYDALLAEAGITW